MPPVRMRKLRRCGGDNGDQEQASETSPEVKNILMRNTPGSWTRGYL